MNKVNFISTALKGMAMGMAEVIPGVSGGTIAFITGIYERLLASISSFGTGLIGVFKKAGVKAVWEAIDGMFLFALLTGMLGGIITGVFGITWLLDNYPPVVWGFFFALIIASSIYMIRMISKWNAGTVALLILGVFIAYGITILAPSSGTEALWFVFLSGCIAISALILPGISGSFILLLLGMYTIVIPSVKDMLKTFSSDSILLVAVFGLGCLTGVMVFSRLLTFVFKNYKNYTISILTGFMIGSLNKIWPWRTCIEELAVNEKIKCIKEQNVLPASYDGDPYTIAVFAAMILGIILVWFLARTDKSNVQ
jgi:putative membrane protein